jgi:ABC-type glycerol-3-phosphate transport system permease component
MKGAQLIKLRNDILAFVVLGPFLVAVIYPMIWLIYTSFKSDSDIFLNPCISKTTATPG